MRIAIVVGARPNFMKAAPLVRELQARAHAEPVLIHTGQHYDRQMSQVFFDDLGLPQPDFCLGTGGATHAEQTARIMIEFERLLPTLAVEVVVVCGDVNSTLAATLVAAKAEVPVAHVEAGLRSFDRSMPEEINRIVTDALSTVLYTPSLEAGMNLRREGIAAERIVFVGNVMIDTLLASVKRAQASEVLARFRQVPHQYAVLTLHRPSNVDTPAALGALVATLAELQQLLPVIFPVHPRTEQRLEEFGLWPQIQSLPALTVTPPLGYLDFIGLLSTARLVMTDSGGIQEETTVLGIPCLTLRENTERPETITNGTNTIVGGSRALILERVRSILGGEAPAARVPELWDGHAAQRIADHLLLQSWKH